MVERRSPVSTTEKFSLIPKQRKNVAISPEMHEALKTYAFLRQIRLEVATEKLLKIGLLSDVKGRENEE